MNKKKMLIVMPHLNTGGAERVVVSYCNWLAQKDYFEVHIAVLTNIKSLYELDKSVIIHEGNIKAQNKIKMMYEKISFTKEVIKQNNIDILFCLFPNTALMSYIAKNKKTSFIFSERCNLKQRKIKEQILCKILSFVSDGIIFQTDRSKKMYPKFCWKKSVVIPNSISNKKCYEIENVSIQKKHIITGMGRLTYQKGFDVLIESFNKIIKKYPNYELHIFGEGDDRAKLQTLIDGYNLSNNVKLLGNDSNAILKIAESEIFVLSSRYEGMPNALMESMAVGTACISTDCETGPSELIENEENGILVPVDNVDILSQKMEELIVNEKLRKKIEINAKKILTTNSPDKIFNEYYEFMKKIERKEF